LPGHALVTRRAVADLVRQAAAGSYGVVGFTNPDLRSRVLSLFRYAAPGVAVRISPTLDVRLSLRVAFGVPIAEVASNVESAVRYSIHQALGRDVDSLVIHVGGLQVRGATSPRRGATPE
jgi:uncharacterized alkaline shock family protein YloU